MPTKLYRPTRYLPDRGDLDNPGWVEAINVMPYGASSWLTMAPLTSRVQLTDTDIRGIHVHPANGTNGWKVYFATDTKIYEVEPATWTETNRSQASWTATPPTIDGVVGASFTAFGAHEIVAIGHDAGTPAVEAVANIQIRLDDTGAFEDMITNAEPETSTGNWPPRAKFVAQWGSRVAIANLTDTGPASSALTTGNDPYLVWVSATNNARTFGTPTSHPGDRTNYYPLIDDYGPITGLAGGAEFGVVFKEGATYVANYKDSSAFGVDFRLVSAKYGCIFPNSLRWVGNQLYFMSNGGPAVLNRNGVRLLGVGEISRTLFDSTWIVADQSINTDLSAPYLLYSGHSQTTGVVSWFYRRDGDQPDFGIHCQISSERFSSSQHGNLVAAGSPWAANIYGSFSPPVLNQTTFSGGHNIYFLSKDSLGNVEIYEPDPSSTTKWAHKPKFVSPWMILEKKQDGQPRTSQVVSLRPLYTLNTGEASGPTVTVTVDSKDKPGTNTAATGSPVSSTTEDVNGRLLLSSDPYSLYKKLTVEYGNATLDNVKAMADVLAGLDIEYEPGVGW